MATTLNAGTATSGAAISADTTGILQLQSGSTPTTAVTIDTAQKVGIGTTSPADVLDVTRASSANSTGGLTLTNTDNSGYGSSLSYNLKLNSTAGVWGRISTEAASSTATYMPFSTAVGGALGERMRINSVGNLFVGGTSGVWQGKVSIESDSALGYYPFAINNTAAGTGSYVIQDFYRNGTRTGTITATGTATSYNSGSDYRLKNDIQPITNALDKVSSLKPSKWTWKSDNTYGDGFVAHELSDVCPNAVTGEKDAVDEEGNPVYQGVDTSFLVATLTAAIQELNAKVDAQALEIQALKGVA